MTEDAINGEEALSKAAIEHTEEEVITAVRNFLAQNRNMNITVKQIRENLASEYGEKIHEFKLQVRTCIEEFYFRLALEANLDQKIQGDMINDEDSEVSGDESSNDSSHLKKIPPIDPCYGEIFWVRCYKTFPW